MKLLLNLLGLALAVFLGYSMEPRLRQQLTGKMPSALEIGASGRVRLQLDDGSQVALESLTADQLPERVVVNVPVKVSDLASGLVMKVEPGSKVRLLRIDGAIAVVSPGEALGEGRVPVTSTDLLKQLSANPPGSAKPPVMVEPGKTETLPPVVGNPPLETPMPVAPTPPPVAPPVAPPPAPVTPPGGESAEPPVVSEPPPTPASAPVPEPTPTTQPAVPVAPAVATSEADVVSAMRESIQSGQIKEFKVEQVLQWKGGADETADGETYKTGTILYKAETFLGIKTIEAKAFVKAGKVHRWIWPRSGMEIK